MDSLAVISVKQSMSDQQLLISISKFPLLISSFTVLYIQVSLMFQLNPLYFCLMIFSCWVISAFSVVSVFIHRRKWFQFSLIRWNYISSFCELHFKLSAAHWTSSLCHCHCLNLSIQMHRLSKLFFFHYIPISLRMMLAIGFLYMPLLRMKWFPSNFIENIYHNLVLDFVKCF